MPKFQRWLKKTKKKVDYVVGMQKKKKNRKWEKSLTFRVLNEMVDRVGRIYTERARERRYSE